MEYVENKEDPLIQIVRTHNTTSTQHCYRQLYSSRQNYREEQDRWRTA